MESQESTSSSTLDESTLRFPTIEELKDLRQQLIDCQPKNFTYPTVNPELKFKWSDVVDYLHVKDVYADARNSFFREVERRIKAID